MYTSMDLVIIPASASSEPYVELGSKGTSGAVFRKHVLTLGDLHYKGKTYKLDDGFYSTLKKNFDDGVSMCQVPVANEKNEHTEDPLRNAGEVVGLEREGNKVYTIVDVRNPDVAKGIRNKTIMGASAMLSLDYKDSRTDQRVGPALLHHCITNRPHVLDLDPYEEVIAATAADLDDTDSESPIVLATEEPVPTKDELIAALKADHGIDVAALQADSAAKADTEAKLSAAEAQLAQAGSVVGLTGEGLETSDVVGAIVELASKNEGLAADVAKLTKKDAERTVQGYIDSGHLLAKSKERAVQMFLSEGQDGLADFLAPEDAPYIKMDAQSGITGEGDGEAKHNFDIDAEIARLGEVRDVVSGHGKK
jgi:hypothetical protein